MFDGLTEKQAFNLVFGAIFATIIVVSVVTIWLRGGFR